MKQILIFLLFAAMLCWFMFAPVYKHIVVVRQALLQQEVDYLLEMGANATYGYIDAVMLTASSFRLEEFGFSPERLQYNVTTTSGAEGTNPDAPVQRGIGIRLEITYPYGQLFQIDRLIGITPPSDEGKMRAKGMKMSEYVPIGR